MSFTEKLDPESLEAFNVATKKRFSEQAQFFLNAFWDEYGTQSEIIYSVAWDTIKKTDMQNKGIRYIHQYDEGNELDFDMALYFFEQLWKFYSEPNGQKWVKDYAPSIPKDMTAIVRKKELRERVDVNFDGKMSFLEYLLYQFNASAKTLMDRSKGGDLPEEVKAALRALEEVNKRVREYETEKRRLEEEAESGGGSGIKALRAKNELAQLKSGPLWEQINKALITAEAAVRIASKKYGVNATAGSSTEPMRTNGTMWWMNRELEEKKKLYGKK
jgi:hypothetical protein